MNIIKPKNYFSVTRLIKGYFPEFNADIVIEKMMSSPNWINSKYYGMKVQEIKDLWSSSAEISAKKGTEMHNAIEEWYTKGIEWDDDSIENKQFKHFKNRYSKFFQFPFHMELQVSVTDKHMKDYNVSDFLLYGIIDAIFVNTRGEATLVDWKRCKDLKRNNKFEKGLGPLSHIDNCNFNHYSLQLNIYKFMLEKTTKLKVIDMCLVVFNPESIHDYDYEVIHVPNMTNEVNYIIQDMCSKCT